MARVYGGLGVRLPPRNELIKIIEKFDRAACAEGIEPKKRYLHVVPKVCSELGIGFVLGPVPNENIEAIGGLFNALYRPEDRASGAVFSGLGSHLDLFFTAYFPVAFGNCALDARKCINASDMQWARIQSVSSEYKELLNQIADVWDVGACLLPIDGYSTPPDDAGVFFRLACNHMEAATAVACTGARLSGAIMSALTCAELSVKCACMITSGVTTEEMRQEINHKLARAKTYIEPSLQFHWPDFLEQIEKLPPFVETRYSSKDWTRLESKSILLAAQRLLALVAIGFNQKSIRDSYPI